MSSSEIGSSPLRSPQVTNLKTFDCYELIAVMSISLEESLKVQLSEGKSLDESQGQSGSAQHYFSRLLLGLIIHPFT